MTEQLPEDVLNFLEASALDHLEGEAHRLFERYKPQPKTLADRFDIQWTRYIVDKAGDKMTEVSAPNGMPVDERGWGYEGSSVGDLHVWPEVEGIDPSELLNNGYQIRAFLDVPDNWHIAVKGGELIEVVPKIKFAVASGWPGIVFCRPPESDQ